MCVKGLFSQVLSVTYICLCFRSIEYGITVVMNSRQINGHAFLYKKGSDNEGRVSHSYMVGGRQARVAGNLLGSNYVQLYQAALQPETYDFECEYFKFVNVI